MVLVHLFTDSDATAAAVRALLPPTCSPLVHPPSTRLAPYRVAEGGCIVFDMDEPEGWWRAMLAETLTRPSLPVLLVTVAPNAQEIVLAMRLGARDVVDRIADGDRLGAAVLEVAARPAEAPPAAGAAPLPLHDLTSRQREILSLASNGLPSKTIARSLNISKRTVDAHRSRMVRRLGAESFLELVRAQIALDLRR